MDIVTASEMIAIDQEIIDRGYSSEILMENAGTAFIDAAIDYLGKLPSHVVVCCGPGNNGGDGMVIARKFILLGTLVDVVFCCDPLKYKGAAKTNYDLLMGLHPVYSVAGEDSLLYLETIFHGVGVELIVDAIFGVGLNRTPKSLLLDIIEMLNASAAPIGSVDIASGIDASSGKVWSGAIASSFTVFVGLLKIGGLLYNGYTHCGRIYLSVLSAPYGEHTSTCHLNDLVPLPPRVVDGHKGSFGQALFVAGARNYYGAPYFASYSFLQSGGGYSRLATVSSLCPVIAALSPEIVFIPLEEADGGYISPHNAASLVELANHLDVVCLGPGISTRDCVSQFVQNFLPLLTKPTVIDGDALTIISQEKWLMQNHPNPWVLTPHIGEFSRLTGKSVDEIRENRIPLLRVFSAEWNAIIVLKDARTVIVEPNGHCWINTSGNDGLAKAGSGDVLTGIICAMASQHTDLVQAVRTAVFLHGLAADLAVMECGNDSLTATKLLDFIPKALQMIRKKTALYQHYKIQCLR